MFCRRVVKHRPKRRGGKERFDVPHFNSSILARPSRQAALDSVQKRQKQAREEILAFNREMFSLTSGMDTGFDPHSDVDFDDESNTELGEDDLPYVPGEAFKPSMRFTRSDGPRFAAGERDLKNVVTDVTFKKVMADSVQGSAVRGNTNSKMGTSAHAASGRGVAKKKGDTFKGDHEEWNHLIADCLGGPTEPHNLVAASAACNSFMLNIESCIRGKSHISLVVTAFCSKEHIAEWIKYEITNKGKSLVYAIDATSPYFTRDDGKELRTAVLKFARGK
jgi:hypothetical protein